MKKTSILAVSAVLVALASVSAFAWEGKVPYATKAPVIDGKVDIAGEWKDSLLANIGMDFQDKNGSWSTAGPLDAVEWKEVPASAAVRFMWDENFIYVSGIYFDSNLFFKIDPSGEGNKASSATNCQDAIQVVLDTMGDAEAMNDLNIIDFTMTPDMSSAMYWQHWGDPRREFSNIKMAAAVNAKGYSFEAAVPWADFEDGYTPAKGDLLGYETVVLDLDEEGMVGLIGDGPAMPWAEPQNINKLYLTK